MLGMTSFDLRIRFFVLLLLHRYGQTISLPVHHQRVSFVQITLNDNPGQEGFHLALDESLEGTGAIDGIIALVHNVLPGGIGEGQLQLFVCQTLAQVGHQQIHNAGNLVLGQGLIEHDLIQTVEELGTELALEQLAHLLAGLRTDLTVFINTIQNDVGTQIGGKDDSSAGSAR